MLTICATAADVDQARDAAYAGDDAIVWPEGFCRRDIAADADEHRPTRTPRGDRIAKWLSRAGVASRRDAERLLAEGMIRLNGKTVTHPATFVSAGDVVQVTAGWSMSPTAPGSGATTSPKAW